MEFVHLIARLEIIALLAAIEYTTSSGLVHAIEK